MAYRALKHMRFGGSTLSPGASVPVEDGRDYAALIRQGIIEEVADAPAGEQVGEATGVERVEGDVAVDLVAMTRDELKTFAEEQGLADKVDLRLAKAKLRDAIEAVLAG